jgi:hypothetical protein
MITDLDIARFAKAQIKRHGNDASTWAACQAGTMLERGNLDGERLWLKILEAIETLQATERPEGTVVQ